MSTVLDAIVANAEAKRHADAVAYDDLVTRLAEGNDADAEEVLSITAAAGRTLDDLRAAVGIKKSRLDAAELLKQLPDALRAEAEANRKLDDFRRKREETLEHLRRGERAAISAVRLATAERARVQSADRVLIETAAGELKRRGQQLEQQIVLTQARLASLRKHASDAGAMVRAGKMRIEPEARPARRADGLLPWREYLASLEQEPGGPRWVDIEERAREDAPRIFGAAVDKARSDGLGLTEISDYADKEVRRHFERLMGDYLERARAYVAELEGAVQAAEQELARLDSELRAIKEEKLRP